MFEQKCAGFLEAGHGCTPFECTAPLPISASLPGLTRQSIVFARKMDARVKPAHDDH
jgi:hypothetical protein